MKIIQRDFFYSFYRLKWMLLLFLLAFLGFCFLAAYDARAMGKLATHPSFEEIFLFSYMQDPGLSFQPSQYFLPFLWLFLHFVPSYLVIRMIWHDHEANGSWCVLQTKSRTAYFLSKLVIIASYLLGIGLVEILIGMAFSRWINTNSPLFLFYLRIIFSMTIENIIGGAFVWILSLFCGFRCSIFLLFCLYTVSSLLPMPFLLGQASLVMRQDYTVQGGYSLSIHILVFCAYLFVLFAIYSWKMGRYDFLDKED